MALTRPARAAVAALASALLLPATLLASSAAHAASAPSSGCADVQVMVSRGTSEPGTIGSMQVVATDITNGTSKTVATWGNPYSAGWTFNTSTPEGVTDLVNHITSQSSACPKQKFVLIGYSQGAMVIGDALGGGSFTASAPLSAALGAKVAAVVLWGDPRFNSAEPFDAGTFTKGVNGSFARTTGALKTYSSRILDYCLKDDGVCQGNGSTNINAGHLAYPTTTAAIQASTNFALGKLSGTTTPAPTGSTPPKPTPTPTSTAPSGGFDFLGWLKQFFPWI